MLGSWSRVSLKTRDLQQTCSRALNSVISAHVLARRVLSENSMPEHIVQYPNADEAAISGLQLNGDGPILFQVIAVYSALHFSSSIRVASKRVDAQVGKLTPGQYHQWVYSPRLGAPRFFQSTMLESISKTSWYAAMHQVSPARRYSGE